MTTNTTDAFGQTTIEHVTNSSFPVVNLSFQERVSLATISALLSVPLALMTFSMLIKLAQKRRNGRIWERFGTRHLSKLIYHEYTVVPVKKAAAAAHKTGDDTNDTNTANSDATKVNLISCGGVSYLKSSKSSSEEDRDAGQFLLSTRTVVSLLIEDDVVHTTVRVSMPQDSGSINRPPRTFDMQFGTKKQANEVMSLVEEIVVMLPDCQTALRTATLAARARRRHLLRYKSKYGTTHSINRGDGATRRRRDPKDPKEYLWLRHAEDQRTLDNLVQLSHELEAAAEEQEKSWLAFERSVVVHSTEKEEEKMYQNQVRTNVILVEPWY